MKHYQEAKRILTESFFTEIEVLPVHCQTDNKNIINDMIEEGKSDEEIREVGNALLIMDLKAMACELQAEKHLKNVQDKPDSPHVNGWKDSAKKLIIELLDMDRKVDLTWEGHGGKMSIWKDDGQYAKLGTVNHWTVVYGDPAPEYGENSFHACQSEYFHLDKKEQAVECLINRYLSGEAYKALAGSGSQSLEDIKATH